MKILFEVFLMILFPQLIFEILINKESLILEIIDEYPSDSSHYNLCVTQYETIRSKINLIYLIYPNFKCKIK